MDGICVTVHIAVEGMYKNSEPIRSQHCGRREMFFRSPSEVYLKFPKFFRSFRNFGTIIIEILIFFDNYNVLECFWKKNFEILGIFFVCKQTSDA